MHYIKDTGDVQYYQVNDGEKKFVVEEGRSDYSNAEQLVLDELNRVDAEMR